MKNKKIILLSLLIPALTLTGCQQVKASNENTTVKATAYKKVYQPASRTYAPVVDSFIFYDKSGHKYEVDATDVEYKYNIISGKFTKAEVVIKNGDPVEAVITLPVSQDKGME